MPTPMSAGGRAGGLHGWSIALPAGSRFRFMRSRHRRACSIRTLPAPISSSPRRAPRRRSASGERDHVITAEEIAKESPKDMNVLRRVPGLTLTQAGGTGSTAAVRIRGTDAKHTPVLIDGIRERSRVGQLRIRPLSARSDGHRAHRGAARAAVGALRLGRHRRRDQHHHPQGPRRPARLGEHRSRFVRQQGRPRRDVGGSGPLSYAFSITGYDTAGFSRYGYRIGRIERARLWPLEPDRRSGSAPRDGSG